MKPYYDDGRGITIYHGDDWTVRPVVDLGYETRTQEGIQAVGGAHRQADEMGRGSSRVEGR